MCVRAAYIVLLCCRIHTSPFHINSCSGINDLRDVEYVLIDYIPNISDIRATTAGPFTLSV